MKPIHFFLSTAAGFLVCLTGTTTLLAQQNGNTTNRQYLRNLYTLLNRTSPRANALATEELSDAENVTFAENACSYLDNGITTLDGMLAAFTVGMNVDRLPPERQRTLGEYFGAVILLGTFYYCPEHQEIVDSMFTAASNGQ